jgi:hypothetical protein
MTKKKKTKRTSTASVIVKGKRYLMIPVAAARRATKAVKKHLAKKTAKKTTKRRKR